jgi:hypothetical protein
LKSIFDGSARSIHPLSARASGGAGDLSGGSQSAIVSIQRRVYQLLRSPSCSIAGNRSPKSKTHCGKSTDSSAFSGECSRLSRGGHNSGSSDSSGFGDLLSVFGRSAELSEECKPPKVRLRRSPSSSPSASRNRRRPVVTSRRSAIMTCSAGKHPNLE